MMGTLGLVAPGAAKATARGAVAAGKQAAENAGKVKTPMAGTPGAQKGVVKLGGGNWLRGSVEREIGNLKPFEPREGWDNYVKDNEQLVREYKKNVADGVDVEFHSLVCYDAKKSKVALINDANFKYQMPISCINQPMLSPSIRSLSALVDFLPLQLSCRPEPH